MTTVNSATNAGSSTSKPNSASAINDINLDMFLKLMITELQNQDPLNPLDNKDMLAQISQLREVGATDKLTQTLDAVLLGQNISSATNLIGADISALSDEAEKVEGVVQRISVQNGEPKLHLDVNTEAVASDEEGELGPGKYAYRVVWENNTGDLFGLDFSGDKAVTTTGTKDKDTSIALRNLPQTEKPKYVYRSGADGKEPFELVGVIADGKQASYIDGLADEDRTGTQLTRDFQRTIAQGRTYDISLRNVSAIRPPAYAPVSVPEPEQEAAAN